MLVRQTIIGILFIITGCVGTIQDANKDVAKAAGSSDAAELNYTGISSAKAVASDKVEITFPPSDLDADNVAYVVRYDGQQIPEYVYGSGMKPDYRGQLRYTVKGLNNDTSYSFSVQLRNITSGVESSNTTSKQAKTFSNLTANFMGISEVRNLTGSDGATGIQVFWSPAETKGSVINKDEIDPIAYEVTIIDGSILGPGSMNDKTFTEPTRRVISAGSDKRSIIVNGLKSQTKYYAQVRAIHFGYSLYSGDPNYFTESNTKYLQISTYSDELSSIVFDSSTFSLSLPSGPGGLYAISASWDAPEGNFDHYRIYYAIHGSTNIVDYLRANDGDNVCSGAETNDPKIFCNQFGYSTNSNNIISGLKTNTNYDFVLAICVSAHCETTKRITTELFSASTTPGVADFLGIKSILPAPSLDKLDQVTLSFDLPNFLSGNISGYILYYYGNDPNSTSSQSVNDPDAANDTGLTVLPYNVYTDTEIVVKGINPLSTDPYCFKLVPFSYNVDSSKNFGDASSIATKCFQPAIVAPDKTSFPGISIANSRCDNINLSITLNWNQPDLGVFANYELFYNVNASSFTFGDAINWSANNYTRMLIAPSKNSYTLTDLIPGKTYRLGILTFYNSINGPIRSEFNTNFFQCSF